MQRFGFIFPGQGSQTVGMGRFIFDEFKIAKETFEEASDALHINIKKLCFEGPDSDLTLTENSQPCILATSIAFFRVLKSIRQLDIVAASGHSVGEYAALTSAGLFDFTDMIQAVRTRGLEMQKATPIGTGGMSAVLGATKSQIQELIQIALKEFPANTIVDIANDNAPGQIVISGHIAPLTWLQKEYKGDIKAKFIPLSVSAPFHSRLMKPAEEAMQLVIQALPGKRLEFPVIQNFKAIADNTISDIKSQLTSQISGQVRWVECMQKMSALSPTSLIECGHGKVLTGLMKKINPEIPVYNLQNLDDIKKIEAL